MKLLPALATVCLALLVAMLPAQTTELIAIPLAKLQAEADAGDSAALVQLALRYNYGPDLALDLAKVKELMMRAAAKGNLTAGGICALNGFGREKDPDLAFRNFEQAADAGDLVAIRNLARCYREGLGCQADPARAFELAQKAATGRDNGSIYFLADYYATGTSVRKNPDKAIELLKIAGNNGCALALTRLGNAYANGEGVAKNLASANELYLKAGDLGEASALFTLGFNYAQGNGVYQDVAKANRYYQKAGELGNASACFSLGFNYERGNGVPTNLATANDLYLKAGELGDARGYAYLGSNYQRGNGVAKDFAKANEFYLKAGKLGDGRSYSNLGANYQRGNGVAKDLAKANEYYEESARLGFGTGYRNLALNYERGDGVPKDPVKAKELYQKANEFLQKESDQGFSISSRLLGDHYAGGKGVQMDLGKAQAYYGKAARTGDAEARSRLEIVRRLWLVVYTFFGGVLVLCALLVRRLLRKWKVQETVAIIAAEGCDEQCTALAKRLRKLLRRHQVVVVPPNDHARLLEDKTIKALVTVLAPTPVPGHIVLQIGSLLDGLHRRGTSIFPVVMNGAQMPSATELPEHLSWFPYLNAIEWVGDASAACAARLAKAIKNRATLEEPIPPVMLFHSALRLGFRPMCFGPLWATVIALGSLLAPLVLLVILSVVFPTSWLGTAKGNTLGKICLFCLWPGAVMVGAIEGKRFKKLGIHAGIAVGAILPWMPLFICYVLLKILILIWPELDQKMSVINSFEWRLTWAISCAVMLSLAGGMLVAAWVAHRRGQGRRDRQLSILWSGSVALVVGGAIGWIASSVGLDGGLLAFVATYLLAIGVLMGFMRGLFLALFPQQARPKATISIPHENGAPPPLASNPTAETVSERTTVPRSFLGDSRRSVFLSYRRADTSEKATAIHEALAEKISGFHVFRDTDAIPFGLDFKAVIEEEVRCCDVFVVLVGPSWLTIMEDRMANTVESSEDFVLVEIETALERNIPIVVALADGAPTLQTAKLPEILVPLARCREIVLEGTGVEELCTAILQAPPAPSRPLAIRERLSLAFHLARRRALAWGAFGSLAAISCAVVFAHGGDEKTIRLFIVEWPLFLAPAGAAFWTSRNWKGVVLRGSAVMATLILVLGLSLGLQSCGFLVCQLLADPMPSDWRRGFVVSGISFLAAAIGGLMVLESVIRSRVGRVRTADAVTRITLGAMVGFAGGFGAGCLLWTAVPPTIWPRLYIALFWLVHSVVLLGTLGIISGAVTGFTIKKR